MRPYLLNQLTQPIDTFLDINILLTASHHKIQFIRIGQSMSLPLTNLLLHQIRLIAHQQDRNILGCECTDLLHPDCHRIERFAVVDAEH